MFSIAHVDFALSSDYAVSYKLYCRILGSKGAFTKNACITNNKISNSRVVCLMLVGGSLMHD